MGYASVGQLDVNSLDADSIAIGETPVYHRDHYHSLTANSEGKVSMGTATYSSANASFSIADTKFYKDGVSAAKQSVTVVSIDKNGALDYSTTYKRYNVPVIATASNGKTGTATLVVSGTAAYNQGYSDGQDAGSGGIDKIYITMISGSSVGVRAYFGSSYNFAWLSPGAYWDGG